MAISYLSSINLNKNELQNAAVQNLATAPSSPSTGQIYYNTAENALYVYANSAWAKLEATVGAGGTVDSILSGSGITVSSATGNVTISHSDTSSVSNVNNSGSTVLQDISFDTFGHVQSVSSTEITLGLLGFTGSTNADNYNGFGITSGAGSISNVGSGSIISVLGGAGISTSISSNEISITNSDRGSSQNIFKAVEADSGSINAGSNNDAFIIEGGSGIVTSADDLTNTLTASVDNTVVRTTGDQSIEGNKTFSNDVVISGNLTVSGNQTITNSSIVEIGDSVLLLNNGASNTPADDAGFIVERGASENVGFIWDESQDTFAAINTSSNGGVSGDQSILSYADIQLAKGILENASFSNLSSTSNSGYSNFAVLNESGELVARSKASVRSDIGAGTVTEFTIDVNSPLTVSNGTVTSSGTILLGVDDATTLAKGVVELASNTETLAMTSTDKVLTPSNLAATRYSQDIGNGVEEVFTINHGLNTRDVIVQIYDTQTFETVYTSVQRTSVNEIAISFNTAPSTNAYKVLIIKV